MSNVYDFGDGRLNRVFRNTSVSCATLTEYATKAGVPVARVVQALDSMLTEGAARLEPVQGEIFLLTGTDGRPESSPFVEPSMWEILRRSGDQQTAYRRWKRIRALEKSGGWRTEPSYEKVMHGLNHVRHSASFGIYVGKQLIPFLEGLTPDELEMSSGPLSDWMRAKAPVVALSCPPTELDRYLTSIRINFVANRSFRIQVLLLEEPAYSALVLDSSDPAVTAADVSRLNFNSTWD
jgi:hypothetical protein